MSHARVFAPSGPFLFGRFEDLAVFGGSAAASLLLVGFGALTGLLHADAPDWTWLSCVVAVDVAHVWSTGFRVYFDAAEVRSRPVVYLGAPALAYLLGVAAHSVSALMFWRMLAYVAVFHFIRQQLGWMALYGRRNPHETPVDRFLDRAAMYAITLGPIVIWHARLPRRFAWMMPGDFVTGLSPSVVPWAQAVCWGMLGAFALRQIQLWRANTWAFGKPLLVLATFVCWYGGIVVFESDYAFTVTNVLLHGAPYMMLTRRYAMASARPSLAARIARGGILPFLLVCFSLALGEEALWDRWVWHERSYWFGAHADLSARALVLLVPLLAVPQLTHYLLDGVLWRVRKENPMLRRELEAA